MSTAPYDAQEIETGTWTVHAPSYLAERAKLATPPRLTRS